MGWQILTSLVVTFLLGLVVRPLVRTMKDGMPIPPPRDDLDQKWAALTKDPDTDKSGEWLGYLERLLFFIAMWLQSYEIIAGWLAFKLGSKWEIWSSVISVPDKLDGIDELEYLIARRRWGSQRLMSFLVGTVANILVAFIGVLSGKHGCEFLRTFLR